MYIKFGKGFRSCGEEIRSGKMRDCKEGNRGSNFANNVNMEDGPIVNGSYNGFLSLAFNEM